MRRLLLVLLLGPVVPLGMHAQQFHSVTTVDEATYGSWALRTPDGGVITGHSDYADLRKYDPQMQPVTAWNFHVLPVGNPLVYVAQLANGDILSAGVIAIEHEGEEVFSILSVMHTDADGNILAQERLRLIGFHEEDMNTAPAVFDPLVVNGQGEAFLAMAVPPTGNTHILKLGADLQPLWVSALPEDHQLAGDLLPDDAGGCYFTAFHSVGQVTALEVGHLALDGQPDFYNSYVHTGAHYSMGSQLCTHQAGGVVVGAIDSNRFLWMPLDASANVVMYKLADAVLPPNVRDIVGGFVRLGTTEWAVLHGIFNPRLMFLNSEGNWLRAYTDSTETVDGVRHFWDWEILSGKGGWAVMMGNYSRHYLVPDTFDNRNAFTLMKDGEWDYCLARNTTVEQEEVPASEIVVTPLSGITTWPLPTVSAGDATIEPLDVWAIVDLCASFDPTVGIGQEQRDEVRILTTLVQRGDPLPVSVDRSSRLLLLDGQGRTVVDVRHAAGQVMLPTAALPSGLFLLVVLDSDGRRMLTRKVVIG